MDRGHGTQPVYQVSALWLPGDGVKYYFNPIQCSNTGRTIPWIPEVAHILFREGFEGSSNLLPDHKTVELGLKLACQQKQAGEFPMQAVNLKPDLKSAKSRDELITSGGGGHNRSRSITPDRAWISDVIVWLPKLKFLSS